VQQTAGSASRESTAAQRTKAARRAAPRDHPRRHRARARRQGRAGGACFIKDFEALSRLYRGLVGDDLGAAVLDSLTAKNIDLLLRSDKDLDLLRGVHGDDVTSRPRPRRPSDASTCDPDGEQPW
jgi:hypothetical protein